MQIFPQGSAATSWGIDNGNRDVIISHNIIDAHNSANAAGITAINCARTEIYRNVIFGVGLDFGAGVLHNGEGDVKIYYNTIYDSSGSFAYGIRERTGGGNEAVVIGNAVFNCSIEFGSDSTNWGAGSGYNATDAATAPGSNNQTSKTDTDQFVSVTGGSENLHLKAGADCIDNGEATGSTSPYDIDIDGTTVSANADIGADELVAAPPEEEEEGAKWPTNRLEWQLERGGKRL